MKAPQLDGLEEYRARFADAEYWAPYVREVGARHRFPAPRVIRNPMPGTFPTFVVDERWVVKFFGHLFEGARIFATEREVHGLVAGHREIPAPAVIAEGQLLEGELSPSWPYLVFEHVPGIPFGEVFDQIPFEEKRTLAQIVGHILKCLHKLSLGEVSQLRPDWEAYAAMLAEQLAGCRQRHEHWGTIPSHLIDQIEGFLPPTHDLVGRDRPPSLLHCDLDGDHVLGELRQGRWHLSAIIDFGDAVVGDPLYELGPLHFGLLRCDKRLLSAYLDGYGVSDAQRASLPAKAMSLALLYPYNLFEEAFGRDPQLAQASTIEALATRLWDVRSEA